MILSCKGIHKAIGIQVILDNITFHIEEGEKAAVVGVNGAGKSTLFRILVGEITPDGGEITRKKELTLGYLAQNQQLEGKGSIYEEMLSVFQNLIEIETNLREMENNMGRLKGQELSDNMEKYSQLQHFFEQNDGYSFKSHIRGVLKGLGFSPQEFSQPVAQLSGGQKTRLYLGKLLLSKPNLLLLDEPTNHLDIASIQWLEEYLKGYEGALLVISHDRYFLDRIVTKVIEIENRKSSIYEGNYTAYSQQKAIHRQIQQKAYENQQREIKHQEDVIKTLRSFNREKSIRRAESREKALEKMEKVARPESLPEQMRLNLTPQIPSGNDVISGENIAKSYPGFPLFENINFDVKRGEKVAIIGPNGIGKSTLFKIILGKVSPTAGIIRKGKNVHIGYYDQEQQTLQEDKTIFEEIADSYPNMTNGEIRTILAAFVFTGDDIFKVIHSLSGGERGRVSLAKIMLSQANLLMLDEPTNHLDMFSKGVLEDAIRRYEGTVIYISHDRYFINRTAQKIWELTPHGIRQYLGNYTYYLEKKTQERLMESENAQVFSEKPQFISDTKAEWLKQKEQQAQERKYKAQIAKIEQEIENTERKIKELETQLFEAASDAQRAAELYEEKKELEEILNGLYEKWEEMQ